MSSRPETIRVMTYPSITLGAYNLEASDPHRLANFWSQITGGESHPGGESVYIAPAGENGFGLFLQPMNGARPERQAAHLDLTVPWGRRDTEVARAVTLGATVRWHVLDEFPHVQWTTLADPDGNLFCIAEHPPST
ncbi:VOC family protein [Brachybacterium sp. GCM10030252]|uniref:VOC family protein n=1 Tax=Brachybacterium sp. GCM10030252 TaxID=3273380 RepID=UPI003622345A